MDSADFRELHRAFLILERVHLLPPSPRKRLLRELVELAVKQCREKEWLIVVEGAHRLVVELRALFLSESPRTVSKRTPST